MAETDGDNETIAKHRSVVDFNITEIKNVLYTITEIVPVEIHERRQEVEILPTKPHQAHPHRNPINHPTLPSMATAPYSPKTTQLTHIQVKRQVTKAKVPHFCSGQKISYQRHLKPREYPPRHRIPFG